MLLQRADGSEPPEILIGGGGEKATMGFTPDGRYLLYRSMEPPGLLMADVRNTGAPRRLMEGLFRYAAISPDGRTIVYDSPESGTVEVYARRFPSMDGKVQLSVGGGGGADWSPAGTAVYYFQGDRIRRVALTIGERIEPSEPETLFELPGLRSFSVAPDGGFYATIRAPDSGIVRQLHLVTNWFEELKHLVPAGRPQP